MALLLLPFTAVCHKIYIMHLSFYTIYKTGYEVLHFYKKYFYVQKLIE